MRVKKKDFWNEWGLPILGSTAFVFALFIFSMLCGVFLMDYDPRIMIEGIERDLRNIFG